MTKARFWLPALAALIMSAQACEQAEPSPAGLREPQSVRPSPAVSGSRLARPDEDLFVEIARQVPSYAGHFIDASGNLAVYVADSTQFAAARSAIQNRISAGRIRVSASMSTTVLKADYTFQQLSDWRDTVFLTLLGKVPGVVFDDLDEGHNRVTIGVEIGKEAQVEPMVLDQLAKAGVPTRAIRFESTDPIEQSSDAPRVKAAARTTKTMAPSTLGSWSDSLMGGLRITWIQSSPRICTVGFTASYSDGTRGFVTASHCSGTNYGTDGSNVNYYQPNNTYADSWVGYERFDARGGTCPLLWPCRTYRFSDANLVADSSTTRHWVQGVLARPANRVRDVSGDTTLSSDHPFLFVTGSAVDVKQGQTIEKIGASSGWTYGTVTNTCIDFWASAAVRCSYKTSMYAAGGDSGAPVFTWDGRDGVIAFGILFGGTDHNRASYFSKWSYVKSELTGVGSFTTFIDITTDVTMAGTPVLIGAIDTGAALSWSGVRVSNATSPTVYYVYRSTWDATTGTWTESGNTIASPTSLSYADTPSIDVNAVVSARPDPCVYSYVEYTVVAYNSGRTSSSRNLYFVGDANGPNLPRALVGERPAHSLLVRPGGC